MEAMTKGGTVAVATWWQILFNLIALANIVFIGKK